MNPFPDNPSPFKDSKDDLNHALEDVKIFQKHFSEIVNQWKKFLSSNKKNKHEEIPLVFFQPSSKNEFYIFTAILSRSNKDVVLGFAYDWLVEQGIIKGLGNNPKTLKEIFIQSYWEQHFEPILL